MVPQLEQVARHFGVPVISGGGFDSTTNRYALAEAIVNEDRPVEVLHIGDHDPSGGHLFLALAEDVSAFVEEMGQMAVGWIGGVEFTRLAVTPKQIRELRLPTAPRKPTDKRAFRGDTCQAEAIAPDVLANIVRQAIESRIDQATLDRVLKREKRDRAALIKKLK